MRGIVFIYLYYCFYLPEITTHLHRDDTEMILFVAPDQEGLVVVMEDATSGGPETAGVCCLKETIALLEEEVIVDQLLLHLLAHTSERIESTLQFSTEARQRAGYLLFHFLVLRLRQTRVEWISLQGAAASHASRHDVFTLV